VVSLALLDLTSFGPPFNQRLTYFLQKGDMLRYYMTGSGGERLELSPRPKRRLWLIHRRSQKEEEAIIERNTRQEEENYEREMNAVVIPRGKNDRRLEDPTFVRAQRLEWQSSWKYAKDGLKHFAHSIDLIVEHYESAPFKPPGLIEEMRYFQAIRDDFHADPNPDEPKNC
jgi:hypothetical protein